MGKVELSNTNVLHLQHEEKVQIEANQRVITNIELTNQQFLDFIKTHKHNI